MFREIHKIAEERVKLEKVALGTVVKLVESDRVDREELKKMVSWSFWHH